MSSGVVAVQDPSGKVFCLLPDEPFFFDPFQLKSVHEVTLQKSGTHEEYKATQMSWVDGTWNNVETPFDEVVSTIATAWEVMNDVVA